MINLDKMISEVLSKMSESDADLPKLNIMTLGKTGAGKSTLINAVFGEALVKEGVGMPVTQSLDKIEAEGFPVAIYDTRGLELYESTQEKIRLELIDEIKSVASLANPDDRVHMIWYCINAGSNRIEDYEIDMINSFAKMAPVIVVLTQSVGRDSAELAKYIESLEMNCDGVVAVLAKDYVLSPDIIVPSSGLGELVDLSYNMLGEGLRRSLVNAQKVDMDKKEILAKEYVKKAMAAATAVGVAPIPFSDAGILVPVQTLMLAKITSVFGVEKDSDRIKSILGGVVGTGGTTAVGRSIVSNALKLIPGGGTLVGSAISGSTAAIVTGALGYAYIETMKYVSEENKNGRSVPKELMKKLMNRYFEEQAKKGSSLLKDAFSDDEKIKR